MEVAIEAHNSYTENKSEDARFLKMTGQIMFILMLLMIACFFTWSENVTITRIIKVVGRMGVLAGSIAVYYSILKNKAVDTLTWKNHGAPFLYFAYLLLGFASFMWSTNVGYSALQWFMTTQNLIFAYFFTKSIMLFDVYYPSHGLKVHRMVGDSTFVLLLVFVIGKFVAPDIFFRLTHGGEEARLGGYMMNPNELGMLAGVGAACFIADLYENPSQKWIIFKMIIITYALMETGSRSSLIGVLLIIMYHIFQSEKKKVKIVIIAAMLIITPPAIWKVVLKDGDPERIEEIMSMTGRLPFWKALITEGLPREPLLGFGFMRIDYKEYFQSTHTYPGKMTHNTFIQVLMNLGFIGLTIVLFQVFFTIRAMLREEKSKRLFLVGIFIPILINSFTEFGIFGESNYGILFYQLIIFSVAFQNRQFLTSREQILLQTKAKLNIAN